MEFEEFRKKVLRVHDTRVYKVTNSYNIKEIYESIRKNKWYKIGRPLTEKEFYSIIRTVNKCLAEELLKGNDITLPYKMGRIELRKFDTVTVFKDGKLKTTNPVSWSKTLELWHKDKEAMHNKTLIRRITKDKVKVVYNTYRASYNNKSFYQFIMNRELMKTIIDKYNNGEFDLFKLKSYNELG